jgi:hypothetical protein
MRWSVRFRGEMLWLYVPGFTSFGPRAYGGDVQVACNTRVSEDGLHLAGRHIACERRTF